MTRKGKTEQRLHLLLWFLVNLVFIVNTSGLLGEGVPCGGQDSIL